MSLPGFQQLSPDVCVAGQLDSAAMDWAAKAGFKSVINNRPDFEGGTDQPTSAAIEAAAVSAGLRYAHLPVAPSIQTPDEVERFARLMDEMPKPILAFCRSGARSGRLFRAASGG
ncbi:MAG: TIGR01244 family sulfur transferase [Caldimonas sp.]